MHKVSPAFAPHIIERVQTSLAGIPAHERPRLARDLRNIIKFHHDTAATMQPEAAQAFLETNAADIAETERCANLLDPQTEG